MCTYCQQWWFCCHFSSGLLTLFSYSHQNWPIWTAWRLTCFLPLSCLWFPFELNPPGSGWSAQLSSVSACQPSDGLTTCPRGPASCPLHAGTECRPLWPEHDKLYKKNGWLEAGVEYSKMYLLQYFSPLLKLGFVLLTEYFYIAVCLLWVK